MELYAAVYGCLVTDNRVMHVYVYRSGTWMMTGNGVMHNGSTVLDDYGQNLDRLKVRMVIIQPSRSTYSYPLGSIPNRIHMCL